MSYLSISIVMPCYNASGTVGRAIMSVRDQTYKKWELIVVDDGSFDGSANLISSIDEPRLKLFFQANAGPAAARNRGLQEASGQFVAFLDADDSWDPRFMERMLAALEDAEDAVLAYCGWQQLGIRGGGGQPFIPPDYEPMDRAETLLGGCRWPIHGVLVRRKAIDSVGGFDETLQTSEDYDLWFRVAPQGRLILVPEVLAYYHHHEGDQVTKNRLRVALNHWRAQEKFLRENPETMVRLGRARVRELVTGELLRRGYAAYWDRDLHTARTLFRYVMRKGYGRPKDWFYMLPSMLPFPLHAWMLQKRDDAEP